MTTPLFTKTVFGKRQKLEGRTDPEMGKRARIWLRRLNRAVQILNCDQDRFTKRWAGALSEIELREAEIHRSDCDLWLDANLIIAERVKYYTQFV